MLQCVVKHPGVIDSEPCSSTPPGVCWEDCSSDCKLLQLKLITDKWLLVAMTHHRLATALGIE